MPRTVQLTLDDYDGVTDLYLFAYNETAPSVILNTGGDLLTPVAEGTFTCTFAETFVGVANIKVKQNGIVVATGGKAYFDSTSGTVTVDLSEVHKLQRSASAVAAGAAVTRNKVSATSTTLTEAIT